MHFIFATEPNPFNATVRFYYYLPVADVVQFEILNINGKCVAVLEEGLQPAGDHIVYWSPNNLADGIYLVRFYVGEESVVQNVSVLR